MTAQELPIEILLQHYGWASLGTFEELPSTADEGEQCGCQEPSAEAGCAVEAQELTGWLI